MSQITIPTAVKGRNFVPSCDTDNNRTYTYSELKSDYEGGMIQPMGKLPLLDRNNSFEDVTISWNLDESWLNEQITLLKRNKLIPEFRPPALPDIPGLPTMPQQPTFSNPPVMPTSPSMPNKPVPKPREKIKPKRKSIERIQPWALFTETNFRANVATPGAFKLNGNSAIIFKNEGELTFDGSLGNYLVAPYSNPSEWSMRLAFRTANNGYYTMVSITNDDLSQPVFQADVYDSKIRMIYALPNRWTGVKDFPINPPGELNNVIYTYSGSVGKIYINGELRGRVDGSGPLPKSTKLVVGRSGDSGRGYQGAISQFEYYNGALSDGQIRELITYGRFGWSEPLSSPSDCGTYGNPTADKVLRIYSPDDCINKLKGTWAQSAICYQDTNYDFESSYSKQCAYLNEPDPGMAQYDSDMQSYNDSLRKNQEKYNNALAEYNSKKNSLENVYQSALNNYETIFNRITFLVNTYNVKAREHNNINDKYRKFVTDQYCFYNRMLKYADSSLFKSTSNMDVTPNSPIVNNKFNVVQNLKYKLVILSEIARLTFVDNVKLLSKNIPPVLEGFMARTPNATAEDVNKQYDILTKETLRQEKNKRLIEYTVEKNNANQNLLTLFGVLNVLAIGIIYKIASS